MQVTYGPEFSPSLKMCGEVTFREGIMQLQEYMQTLESTLENCTLRHIFAPGSYAREMTIPKGTLIIGKIHKHAHLNIISKGKVRVATEFGPLYFEAPHTFVSEVGTKRAVYALEDTIWTTIHVTEETDLVKIEDYVIAKSYEELEALGLSPRMQIKGEIL
jgi:quercetin dioxygenase-like cupin family protein